MKGVYAKYKGKEFSAYSKCDGTIILLSGDISDVENYGFEKCEPYDRRDLGQVVCEKTVHLSEVDEYYYISIRAVYKGYKGDIGRPTKDNKVVFGIGLGPMTRDEAEKLGMESGYGEFHKEVSMNELELFEEKEDYDINKLVKHYEQHKPSITDNDADLQPMLNKK